MANTNRDRQHEDSMRFVSISILGIIILMIIMTLFGGCATTQPSKKCCDKHTYYKPYYPPTRIIVVNKNKPVYKKRHIKVKVNKHRKRK